MADRNIVDQLYDLLPRSWQERLYDRWFGQEATRFDEGQPERTDIIGRSHIYGDVQASVQQAIGAWEQEREEWYQAANDLEADGREVWDGGLDREDADLDRLEHEQSTAAGLWSGDRGAELERLERSEETHSERSLDEPPERGIEDDEQERGR